MRRYDWASATIRPRPRGRRSGPDRRQAQGDSSAVEGSKRESVFPFLPSARNAALRMNGSDSSSAVLLGEILSNFTRK